MSNINVNNLTPHSGETKVSVSGSFHASGNITANGNITLGDANTDNIILSAEISSSIIPDITTTFDLGSSDKRWNTLYSKTGTFTNITASGNPGTGNISASGNILSSNFSGASSGTNTGDQDLGAYATTALLSTTQSLLQSNINNKLNTAAPLFTGAMTGSGPISGSSLILAAGGIFTGPAGITSTGNIQGGANITTQGNSIFGNAASDIHTITGNVTASGTLTVTGKISSAGTVIGNMVIGGAAGVTSTGNINGNANITVLGNAIFGNAASDTHTIAGNVTASGNLTVASDINANGNIVGDGATNLIGINNITGSSAIFSGNGLNGGVVSGSLLKGVSGSISHIKIVSSIEGHNNGFGPITTIGMIKKIDMPSANALITLKSSSISDDNTHFFGKLSASGDFAANGNIIGDLSTNITRINDISSRSATITGLTSTRITASNGIWASLPGTSVGLNTGDLYIRSGSQIFSSSFWTSGHALHGSTSASKFVFMA